MSVFEDKDSTAKERKADHIKLAFESQLNEQALDQRFYYEPALTGIPDANTDLSKYFLNHRFEIPMWISSMTGGTERAKKINENLARACHDYGMGMGLGSCRSLLTSNEFFEDFNVRKWMPGRPLYANLGIAQLAQLIDGNKLHLAEKLVEDLDANGLIIHINPLQEYLQPEGDMYSAKPVEMLEQLLDKTRLSVIVKEVGQGFGPESIRKLMQLPIAALDFGASGGTNFALLELLRAETSKKEQLLPLAQLGHSAGEMISFVNELPHPMACSQIIISGGIQNFLDGFYLMNKSKVPAIYAQASGFLKHALEGYDQLCIYIENQIAGLRAAQAFLKIKD